MAASAREAALAALFQQLQANLSGPQLKRNAETPEVVPAGGIVVMRDGDAGEPVDQEISPPAYSYEHPVEIEVLVKHADAAQRASDLDEVLQAVQAAVAADRSLSGAVEYAELSAPADNLDEHMEGDAGVKAALITVILAYTTSDPLL